MISLLIGYPVIVITGRLAYIRENRRLLLYGTFFLALGMACAGAWNRKLTLCEYAGGLDISAQDNENVQSIIHFQGTVAGREKDAYRIRVKQLGAYHIHTHILMECKDVLTLGSTVEGEGRELPFSTATNPGQFDEKSYEQGRGNLLQLGDVKLVSVKEPVIGVREGLNTLREHLGMVYEGCLNVQDASLAKAMVLGDRSNLDSDMRALYQRNGIAHLIAISGLHIAMLGGALYHLLRRISGSYPLAAGIGSLFILSYGILTGLSGATLRAMIMLLLSMGADVLGRRYDAATAMAVALLSMLIANPGQLYQVGFQLSFGAVCGIAVVYPVAKDAMPAVFGHAVLIPVSEHNVWQSRLRLLWLWMENHSLTDGLCLSICVQLVTAPILLYFFYELPAYGVVLNVVVVPLMSILLFALIVIGLSGSLAGFIDAVSGISDAGALGSTVVISGMLPIRKGLYIRDVGSAVCRGIMDFAANAAERIFDLYEGLCRMTERLPGHTLCVGRPDVRWIILYYILLALVIWLVYIKCFKKAALAALLWCMVTGLIFLPGKLLVCMLDVGQGDGLYIRTPEHQHILIDGGSTNRKKIGTYVLKNGLKYYGGTHLSYVIVTHCDSDHYSGVLELLEDETVTVDHFVLPYIANPDEAYQTLEQMAIGKGCRLHHIQRDDRIAVGDVVFTCLNPVHRVYEDKNSGSVVLWMQYRDFDMLFTGDMDAGVEREILGRLDAGVEQEISDRLNARGEQNILNGIDAGVELLNSITSGNRIEVYKVAHHGSATASSEEFLERFHFDTSIISVAERNAYGHPAPEVMNRLKQYCNRIYLTKDSGAVTIETDGKRYSIREFLKE